MSEEEKQKPKEYQKIIARLKSLNIIMNKIVFYLWFKSVCYDLVIHIIIINKIDTVCYAF